MGTHNKITPRRRPCSTCPYRRDVPAENIDYDAIIQYQSPVPLFGSGTEAAEHGKREIDNPSPTACVKIQRLLKQREKSI